MTRHFKVAPFLAARVCTAGRPYVAGEEIPIVVHPKAVRVQLEPPNQGVIPFCPDCGLHFLMMEGLKAPVSRIEVVVE